METLQDAYGDGNSAASTPSLDAPVSIAVTDTLPESDHAIETKNSSETLAIEELPLPELANQAPKNTSIDPIDSPSLPPVTDGDDDEDEEEEEEEEVERSPKRQRQLSDLAKPEPMELEITDTPSPGNVGTPVSENGKVPAGSKSSKKSKKKSKDVWVTTSRKGKKKTKHAENNGSGSKEDKVFITPITRFPDRTDDSPDEKICLSKVYKAEKVELSEDRLTAGSTKGYRMVRATRGVAEGAWYFEIKVMSLGETGHTRLGWSMEKGDLQAPVGYDANSFGYRDIDGSKVHKALREKYGEEGYKEGDVIGFYINLPVGGSYAPTPAPLVWYKGQRYVSAPGAKEDPPKVVPGSEISYYKNGICQGVAFRDLYGGCYYPAASMYTLPNQPNCVVKFNFGPDFEKFPEEFGERPAPRPMIEVPYQSHDGRVENGLQWNMTRMCPMFKVTTEE